MAMNKKLTALFCCLFRIVVQAAGGDPGAGDFLILFPGGWVKEGFLKGNHKGRRAGVFQAGEGVSREMASLSGWDEVKEKAGKQRSRQAADLD